MSRKRRVRKVYALVNPITMAMEGCAITPSDKLDKLRMLELSAIEAFAKGRATPDDWRALADMLNVTEIMAGMGIGPEALEPCMQAQAALGAAHARHKAGKPLLFTGPELQLLRDCYAWHDLQRQSVARSQYEAAIRTTTNRIRGAAPGVKVYIA